MVTKTFNCSFYHIHDWHEVIQNWYHWNIFFSALTHLFFPFLLCFVNLCTALILSGPPQYNFTFQVKNNSARRILLLSWNMNEDNFQIEHFQGKIFIKDCKMFPLCRKCFHKFLMACYFKGSTKVMPFNMAVLQALNPRLWLFRNAEFFILLQRSQSKYYWI